MVFAKKRKKRKQSIMKKMLGTIKRFVNSPLMRFLLATGSCVVLLVNKEIFMSGIACGVAIREFLLAFKED